MAVIPFAEWTPDLPEHGNGLVTCRNVISRTPESYGPMPGLAPYGSMLSRRCQGAFTARDTSGDIHIFAGDAHDLYRLTAASTNWENVSRSGGQPDYAVGAEEKWQFAQYGSRVVATNLTDEIQSYVLGQDAAFSALSVEAPRARYASVVREFLMVANTSDPTDGNRPERVWWSANGDPTNWPAPGTSAAAAAESDFQDLVGDGGWVQGIVGGLGNADVAIVQERALWRGLYVGPPLIFQFDKVEGARGTPAPNSIVQLGGVFAYLGEDGFYLFDGTQSVPIGANKIDKTFFNDIDQTYYSRMSATVDPINKVFYWAYAGAGHSNGDPNRLLAYNWTTQRWSLIEATVEHLFRAGTFGANLDAADTLGYTVDTSPFGPDSRFWAGGRSILAAFDTQHRLNFFSGSNLAATLETGDLDLGEGRRVFVSGVRLITDGGAPTARIGYRDTPGGALAYTPTTIAAADGYCPQRISARFARLRLDMPAGSSFTHIKGFEPRLRPEGLR